MTSALTARWNRVFAVLGRVSMYRLVLLCLGMLAAYALTLSLLDALAIGPLELMAALAVLVAVCAAVDAVSHRVLGSSWRLESSLITALILLFVLRPTLDPAGLAGLALAGAVASASKYLLAWRGRHLFNPAAAGAAVLTVVSVWLPGLGASSWWVGTPLLAAPVIVLGLVVLLRTEKVRVVGVFVLVAIVVAVVRVNVQYQAAGIPLDLATVFWSVVWSSPFLFLGAFMLSEPLTLPPRRWQQLAVAVVVGVLAGWPIDLGEVSLGQERALLVGNVVAFCFAARSAVRLRFEGRRTLTPTVRELTFRAGRGLRFVPGQYVELEVPHAHPDARGTRREFSIVSAPRELPELRIALREGGAVQSTYKRALAAVAPGDALAVTGVWGDFVLPRRSSGPVLMVAAGIGVTPFVSQLTELGADARERDIVLVYVASEAAELAFRPELEASGIPVVVFTRDRPAGLPSHWRWAGGARLDADGLLQLVPDIHARHAYVSGPPGLIAELAPVWERARSVTTDAFSGY
ncbi:FAD-dependent oxidoreductase [Microbacterium sp.]|uniref:FAD-dependent oxidoreductase n=1 Tax=Microbacterium sp. TaxID=51671 RepID=UPI0039E5534B